MFNLATQKVQSDTLYGKVQRIDWGLVLVLTLLAGVGFALLYSATRGVLESWPIQQMIRFSIGIVCATAVGLVSLRVWHGIAWLSYGAALLLLILVPLLGGATTGAQRWLDLGIIKFQPSEPMKLALILALARYYESLPAKDISRLRFMIIPVVLTLIPAMLIMRQPDLGTAFLIVATGGIIIFLAGVRILYFVLVVVVGVASLPVLWSFLKDYQKERILSFVESGYDPLGAGYHILQSQIALGSGGVFGRGFLQGTQTQLSFLPELQTDFIFTILAEDFGLMGGLVLLFLCGAVLWIVFRIARNSVSTFGHLIAMGVGVIFFLHAFINMAMVMGLLPVVGIPLPLISYGGSSMLTFLLGFGLVLSAHIHQRLKISGGIGAMGGTLALVDNFHSERK
ncbi:MAG: rod shape-determining protein RodA [Parvularculales bacterium]